MNERRVAAELAQNVTERFTKKHLKMFVLTLQSKEFNFLSFYVRPDFLANVQSSRVIQHIALTVLRITNISRQQRCAQFTNIFASIFGGHVVHEKSLFLFLRFAFSTPKSVRNRVLHHRHSRTNSPRDIQRHSPTVPLREKPRWLLCQHFELRRLSRSVFVRGNVRDDYYGNFICVWNFFTNNARLQYRQKKRNLKRKTDVETSDMLADNQSSRSSLSAAEFTENRCREAHRERKGVEA